MAKKKLKQKLIFAFLIWVIILLLPGWIARQGWKNIPPMAWFWIIVLAVAGWEKFVVDYSENQKIDQINKGIKELQKQLKNKKK